MSVRIAPDNSPDHREKAAARAPSQSLAQPLQSHSLMKTLEALKRIFMVALGMVALTACDPVVISLKSSNAEPSNAEPEAPKDFANINVKTIYQVENGSIAGGSLNIQPRSCTGLRRAMATVAAP